MRRAAPQWFWIGLILSSGHLLFVLYNFVQFLRWAEDLAAGYPQLDPWLWIPMLPGDVLGQMTVLALETVGLSLGNSDVVWFVAAEAAQVALILFLCRIAGWTWVRLQRRDSHRG